MFVVNYDEARELKPAGKYEVLIDHIEQTQTKKGTPCISIKLKIREDVENPAKSGYLFVQLYRKKEPSEAEESIGGYSIAQLQAWCKAAGVANGTAFGGLDDILKALIFKPVLVEMKHEEYNGRTNERVNNFPEPTKHLLFTEITDEDVPF